MMVDSHAHLDSPEILSDLEAILDRAVQAGVGGVLSIACAGPERDRIETVIALCEKYPMVYAAAGVHPHEARFWRSEVEKDLVGSMEHPKVLAWGEIGLDFHYDHSPRQAQVKAFREQLQRARQLEKPVIIHSRAAAEQTCRILEEELGDSGIPGGVMHCFTYDSSVAQRCLELGFHLGFGGIVTFPRSETLRQVARMVPSHRYLIETDSPYLAPVPYRGKRNEPSFVVKVGEMMARIRETSLEAVAAESTRNFRLLFALNGQQQGSRLES